MRIWGLGDLGTIFIVNIIRRIAGKLHRIILLHFWTSNFSISLWENSKTRHVHDLGIFGRVHDSQNKYYLSSETRRHSRECKKKPDACCKTYYVCKSQKLESHNFENVGQVWCRRSVSTFLEKLQHGIKIYKKTRHRRSTKNMQWMFLNLWNFETWTLWTKKPTNQ